MKDMVYKPSHYTSNATVETIDVLEAVIDGLPAREANCLSHVLRYSLRAGKKTEDASTDLAKANNYAHRLVTGKWRKVASDDAPTTTDVDVEELQRLMQYFDRHIEKPIFEDDKDGNYDVESYYIALLANSVDCIRKAMEGSKKPKKSKGGKK